MILTTNVEVSWNNANKKIYVDKGYEFTKLHDKFTIPLSDLSSGSNIRISVQCDYCGDIYNKSYKDYNKNKMNSKIEKDCCKKCWNLKIKQTIKDEYGVDNVSQLQEVRRQIKRTLLQNYGVDNPLKSNIVVDKIKRTNLKKYGVEWSSQREDVKSKTNESFMERFGTHILNTPNVRMKRNSSMIKKYGHTSAFALKKFRDKGKRTMYQNGTAPCSKQQLYVNGILCGQLNYPVSNLSLDIAFPDKMIYVECDFRGHDLHVRLGHISQNVMDNNETKRYHYLRDNGWKMVRIVSKRDKVPSPETLLYMSEVYQDHFESGHSWIKFDLDSGSIQTSLGEAEFDYGKLNRLS